MVKKSTTSQLRYKVSLWFLAAMLNVSGECIVYAAEPNMNMEHKTSSLNEKNALLQPYLKGLVSQIQKNWTPSRVTKTSPVLTFHINPDGSYSKLKAGTSTGFAKSMEPAFDSIRSIKNFGSLPKQFSSGVDVAVTFSDAIVFATCYE